MKRSIKLVFSTNVAFLLLSVITSLLSAWALKPEGRGNLALITMWTALFSYIGAFGVPYAHRYWAASRPDWNSRIFTNTIVATTVCGVMMILLGWLIVPGLTADKGPGIVFLAKMFVLNVPIIILSELLRGQLEGARMFGWLGIARLSFIAAQGIGNLKFYLAGLLTLESALLIITFAQLLCAGIMLGAVLYTLRPKWDLSWQAVREEISYGLRSYPGILTEITVWRLDQMILAVYASSTVVGLYTVAVALAEITSTLASSAADALLPEVAASADQANSSQLVGQTFRLTLYAQLAMTAPLWTLAPTLLRVVYGEGFEAAAPALRLLLFASIIWSSAMIIISGLNGLGRPGLSTLARLCSGVVTAVTLVYFLPRYGMIGAAISSLIGYGAMFSVAFVCLLRVQNISPWEFARPRREDISIEKVRAFLRFGGPVSAGAKS
jgi:O-antigen/teichoic acid export membrane protein